MDVVCGNEWEVDDVISSCWNLDRSKVKILSYYYI